jgi:hypothetical protein
LCVPAFRVCCAFSSDVRSPGDGVSEYGHRESLYMISEIS